MNQETKAKGISLIVLVITIIIIIILAGAVILSLSNSGIISKAKIAKESNDFVAIREAVETEKSNGMFEGNTASYSSVVPASYSQEISVIGDGIIIIKGVANSKITDISNALEKLGAVYIPLGFEYLEGTKETGLVIKDVSAGITNNEYVWIPVEGTLERKAFVGENLTTDYVDDTSSAGYTPMKTSVEKYKGFYVSRYEAGTNTISDGSNLAMDGSLKPLSQKNMYVWNNIPWDSSGNYPGDDTQTGAALVAKMAYNGNTAVASSLLYGAQYDAMLNYINSTSTSVINSTTWGNHYNSSISVSAGAKYSTDYGSTYIDTSAPTTKPANTAWLLTTGASEQSKAKNIYDVAGNVFEWTYELYPAYSYRVMRSGIFDVSGGAGGPAAYRCSYVPDNSYCGFGFRFALYIK